MPDKKKEESTEKDSSVTSTEPIKNEDEKTGHSGVFTADGEELPDIDGGYTISGTGVDPNESDFIAV